MADFRLNELKDDFMMLIVLILNNNFFFMMWWYGDPKQYWKQVQYRKVFEFIDYSVIDMKDNEKQNDTEYNLFPKIDLILK